MTALISGFQRNSLKEKWTKPAPRCSRPTRHVSLKPSKTEKSILVNYNRMFSELKKRNHLLHAVDDQKKRIHEKQNIFF